KDGPRTLILKLIARESPGLRGIAEPQVQQTIRDTLRNRKEQLLRLAYLAIARDGAQVKNFLAEQVIEAAGKLPDAANTTMPGSAARTCCRPSASTAPWRRPLQARGSMTSAMKSCPPA